MRVHRIFSTISFTIIFTIRNTIGCCYLEIGCTYLFKNWVHSKIGCTQKLGAPKIGCTENWVHSEIGCTENWGRLESMCTKKGMLSKWISPFVRHANPSSPRHDLPIVVEDGSCILSSLDTFLENCISNHCITDQTTQRAFVFPVVESLEFSMQASEQTIEHPQKRI